jgi:hypothetical protein
MGENPRGMMDAERRPGADRVWLPWLAAWFGGAVLAIVNGIARRALYENLVGALRAHYIATAVLIALFGGYFWALDRRWPIPTRRAGLAIGGSWTVMTILFEFGLGHYVAGQTWSELLEQYDVRRGYVWVLVPLWTAFGPTIVHQVRARKSVR